MVKKFQGYNFLYKYRSNVLIFIGTDACTIQTYQMLQWKLLVPFFVIDDEVPKPGRPREWSFRTILNAIFYINKTGCQWRMLPSDYPPWSTVYDYYRHWRISGLWETIHTALRREVRIKIGKNPEPTGACIDSQSVKTALSAPDSRGMMVEKKSMVEIVTSLFIP